MSPEIADEVRTLLDESGLPHSQAAEFSTGPELVLEAVTVLSVAAGGITSLAAVIKRHDGKRFSIERDGEKIEAAGFSEQAVKRLVEKRASEQAEQPPGDERWCSSIVVDRCRRIRRQRTASETSS